jgi:hypothetical protein
LKPLRPITIVALGAGLLAIALTIGVRAATPDWHWPRDAVLALLIGAIAGLAIFGPIAALLAVANRRGDWFHRHAQSIHWIASVAMCLSLGYLIACGRSCYSDIFAALATFIVVLGAVVKLVIGNVVKQEQEISA